VIARLQNVHLIVDEIKAQCQDSNSDYEPSLDAFSPHVQKLVTEFPQEFEVYHLDEIVVGAIAPVVSF
jgi:tuftelin-interacting protein 11